MAAPVELPVRAHIWVKAGMVRVEVGSTTNPMNGTDDSDWAFSLTPEMALEVGRRLIGAALRAQDELLAANLERKKNQS